MSNNTEKPYARNCDEPCDPKSRDNYEELLKRSGLIEFFAFLAADAQQRNCTNRPTRSATAKKGTKP